MYLETDKCYFIVPYGLGDALITCGLKDAIEEKYKCKFVPIIKPSHETVVKMYGINEYIVHEFTQEELNSIGTSQKCPQKGHLFVAHPAFTENKDIDSKFLRHEIGFVEMFTLHFGLEKDIDISKPLRLPAIDIDIKKRLNISSLDNVILIAPEMKSASENERIGDAYFIKLIENFKRIGIDVVVNADIHKKLYEDDIYDLSLDEIVYLSANCKKVICQRSGLADLLYNFANDMDVLYPNRAFYDLFHLENIFKKPNSKVRELTVNLGHTLENKGINRIAIYGYGNVGKRMEYSLKKENIKIDYFIDNNTSLKTDIPVFSSQDNWNDTETIIVSISDDTHIIENMINNKGFRPMQLRELMKLPYIEEMDF